MNAAWETRLGPPVNRPQKQREVLPRATWLQSPRLSAWSRLRSIPVEVGRRAPTSIVTHRARLANLTRRNMPSTRAQVGSFAVAGCDFGASGNRVVTPGEPGGTFSTWQGVTRGRARRPFQTTTIHTTVAAPGRLMTRLVVGISGLGCEKTRVFNVSLAWRWTSSGQQ